MAKRRFFTVGFTLPGDDFEFIPFSSDQTLLDADVVLFEPTLGNHSTYDNYAGMPLLSEQLSFKVHQSILHWRSEIIAAVEAGRLVIIYLSRPEEHYRYTGEKSYSGTGKSRTATRHVEKISSYDAVPNTNSVLAKRGTEIKLTKDAGFLASYWNEFAEYSQYEVEIKGTYTSPLLLSKVGERVVGAHLISKNGNLLYLPPIRYDEEVFTETKEGDEYWTDEGTQFGKRLASSLASLADSLKGSTQSTPPPIWVMHSEFRLAEESHIEMKILKIDEDLGKLQNKKVKLESQLEETGVLRNLLFEQGKPLETAIIKALKLLRFTAVPFADGESEFDAIFEAPEGRFLGEAEGKDSKAVNIDKLSQLERNLQEDFQRDGIDHYAKGVLFGNAQRLKALSEREDFFTAKCITGAKRAGIALIRTPDLFTVAKYMSEFPDDLEFAKRCREVIAETAGKIVIFPEAPKQEKIEVCE